MSGKGACLSFSVENLLGLRNEEQQHHSLREEDLPDFSGEELDNRLPKDGKYQRTRRRRILFTESQVEVLKSVFAKQKYLSSEGRKKLAESLNLSPKQVKTWFQNYRYKCRRKSFDDGYAKTVDDQEMASNLLRRTVMAAAPPRISIPHSESAVIFRNPCYSLEQNGSQLNSFYDPYSLVNFSYGFPSKFQHLPTCPQMHTN